MPAADGLAGEEGGPATALDPRRNVKPPRPPGERKVLDPFRPAGVTRELERLPASVGGDAGAVVPALTIFLTGRECPFACVFCDLWKETLEGPTPPGALPAQVAEALEGFAPEALRGGTLKLYNASNFFDVHAVPREDRSALARLAAPFGRVVVECHPRLVGPDTFAFARELGDLGVQLEVAMGLETVHPEAFPRLGKGMELEDFGRAAARLTEAGLGVRAFVLLGAPFVPREEAVFWAVESVRHALEVGASHVSLIPLRSPAPGAPAPFPVAAPITLEELEEALDRTLELALELPEAGEAVVTADLWDLQAHSSCPECFEERRERLEALNLTGRSLPRISCPVCASRG